MAARLSTIFPHCAFFNSLAVAKASASAPLVMALTATAFFMGAISEKNLKEAVLYSGLAGAA